MNMGGPPHIGGNRPKGISPRLSGLEFVAAPRVSFQACKALEVRIKWRRVPIRRVSVTPVCVCLPHFECGVRYRFASDVENPAHDVQKLPLCTAGVLGRMGQVSAARSAGFMAG